MIVVIFHVGNDIGDSGVSFCMGAGLGTAVGDGTISVDGSNSSTSHFLHKGLLPGASENSG